MYRRGCFDIQINDQCREIVVNQVCDELHKLTGVEQRVTSAYHPQVNGLVERQNRTIRNSLVSHSSTKYSPFMMLYNREPVLPIDVKHNLDREKKGEIESGNQEPFYL